MKLTRRVLHALGGLVALALALGVDGVTYTVLVEDGRLVVRAFGERFEGPRIDPGSEPLKIAFSPQDRRSTPQVLLRGHGPLLDGLAVIPTALSRRPVGVTELRQPRTQVRRYYHFNPFRASITVSSSQTELRLEVNVPDASVEAWQGTTKLQAVKLRPGWLRLMLAPLLAALAAAWLLVVPFRTRAPETTLSPTGACPPEPYTTSPPRWWEPALAALAGGILVTILLLRVSEAVPGFGDEMNYLMQGRIFASGRVWVPEPPDPEFFRVSWMDMFGSDGRIWGFHPPGNSLVLALGWLAGCYWLTVPLVAGLLFAVQYLLAFELFGRRHIAVVHVLVMASSHYILALAASFMAHTLSMLLLSLLALFGLRFLRRGATSDVMLAALASGAAFTVRPLSAILATLPIATAMLARQGRRRWPTMLAAALVGAVVASSVLLYTWVAAGRLTLPYAVKGPEASRTLVSRLDRTIDEHLANLYRNCNELQHRFHSGGIILNLLLPMVALVTARRQLGARALALLGSSFCFFVVAHSLLHWYGWMWEPRMLYDVAFMFFLAASGGVATLLSHPSRASRWRFVPRVALLFGLAASMVDLAWRFSGEYRRYNATPRGVMRLARENRLQHSIVFFGAELPYSCYTPFNTPGFDGDPLFARHRGLLYDYRLLARFPDRQAWFTRDGETVVGHGNFYRRDLHLLEKHLAASSGPPPVTVVPWLRVAPSPLLASLPGRVVDPDQLLESLVAFDGGSQVPQLVVLLPGAGDLAGALDLVFETSSPPAPPFETEVTLKLVGRRRSERPAGSPGLLMRCFEGTTWSGTLLDRRLVSTTSPDVCAGEERSLVWQAELVAPGARRVRFTLESDDGSGIFLDGKLLLDNGLASTHGMESRTAEATLAPGRHSLEVRYFNGPGEGYLNVSVEVDGGPARPLSLRVFGDDTLLVLPGSLPTGGEAARESRPTR